MWLAEGFSLTPHLSGLLQLLVKEFLAFYGTARRNGAVNDGYKAPSVCPIPNPELWRSGKSHVGIFLNHKVSFELWKLCSQEEKGEEITKGSLPRAEQ